MRSMPLFFYVLLLSIFIPSQGFAARVKKMDKRKKTLIVELTRREVDKFMRGERLQVKSRSNSATASGKIVKMKGRKAYVKITRGSKKWKKREPIKLVSNEPSWKQMYGLQKPARRQMLPRKRYSIVPEVGTSVFPVPAAGMTATYAFSPLFFAEFNYARGQREFDEAGYADDPFGLSTELDTEVISVRAKKMWGTSLYTNTGIGYRNVTFTGTVTDVDPAAGLVNLSSGEDLFVVTRQDIVVDLSIGNRWQAHNYSFGVDWAGLLVPVNTMRDDSGQASSASTVVTAGEADASLETINTDYKEYYDYSLPGVSFQAKLYFGVSF